MTPSQIIADNAPRVATCQGDRVKKDSHIAKLSESIENRELCDSTICEDESLQCESVRETPRTMSEVDDSESEVIANLNNLLSTSSIVSPIVQVDLKEEKLNTQQPTPLEVKDEGIIKSAGALATPPSCYDELMPVAPTSPEEDVKGAGC